MSVTISMPILATRESFVGLGTAAAVIPLTVGVNVGNPPTAAALDLIAVARVLPGVDLMPVANSVALLFAGN